MLSQLNGLKAELKQLERKTCKQLKLVEKLTSKKRKNFISKWIYKTITYQ